MAGSPLTPCRANRVLSVVHPGPAIPPVPVLQLQRIQSLLVILGRIHLVDARQRARGHPWWRGLAPRGRRVGGFPPVGLILNGGPFPLAQCLSRGGAVLLLRVLVRAIVKELGVDLHEQLHGVVNHAVDSSWGRRLATGATSKPSADQTNLFQ